MAFALPAQAQIRINEVDADQSGTDSAEFVELYNLDNAPVDLSPYVLVLYNGSNDAAYSAIDLDGQTIPANGYFVIGSASVANVDLTVFTTNGIQNGADAVALYTGSAADFPNNTPATQANLVDALVYDTNDGDDSGLLSGLGQTTQYNEGENGSNGTESNQRSPDGTGTFIAATPTPGAANASLAQTVTFSFDAATATIAENGNTMVTVTMITSDGQQLAGLAEADVALTSGDAADLTGFTSPQTISYSIGQASGSTTQITLTANDDALIEGSEDLVFTLNNFTGASAGTNGTFTLTITDNDAAEAVFASATQAANEGDGTVDLTVNISQAPAANFTVDVALTSGDAADLGSYTTQTVTFPAGVTTAQTVTVTLTDDNDVEGSEDFVFTLQNPQGGVIGTTSTLTLTVADNDQAPLPTIVINEVDADQSGTDSAEFVELYNTGNTPIDLSPYVLVRFNGSDDRSYGDGIDLDGFTLQPGDYFVIGQAGVPNVDLAVFTPNDLQNGADAVALYTGEASSFPNDTPVTQTNLIDAVVYGTNDSNDSGLLTGLGQTTQYNDTATESIQRDPDGSATFTTTAPTPGTANAQQSVTFSFDTAATTIAEDGSTMVTVTMTTSNGQVLENAASADVALTSGDAADLTGFTSPQTISYPAGQASGATTQITLTGNDDALIEGSEDLVFTLNNFTGASAGTNGTFTLSITDNDGPQVAFQAATANANETDGTVDLTLTLTQAPAANFSVDVALTSGDAADLDTYATQTATFTPAGALTQTVTVTITNDADLEGEETFVFTLQNVQGNGSVTPPSTLTLTLADDEQPANLVINELDSDQPGAEEMEFIELYNNDASAVALDPYVLVFFNGSNDQSYAAFDLDGQTIAANGFFVLGDPGVPNVNVAQTISLQNGADAVALYVGSAADFPNGTEARTFNLVAALGYGTNDATDFDLLRKLNDGVQFNEAEYGQGEVYSLQRFPDGTGAPQVAVPTPGAANVFYTQRLTVGLDAATASVDEGGSAVVNAVVNTEDGAPTAAPVTANLTLTIGDVDDFTGLTGRSIPVTIPAGTATGDGVPVTVATADDTANEGDEETRFQLTNVAGADLSGQVSFIVNIIDDDQPGFAFQTATLAVNEGAGTAQIVVALSTASDTDLTVDVALTSGDASDIGGFTTQTLTFPAGSTDPQTITLDIVDDDEAEGGESLTFELQNQSASAKLNSPSTLTLSIQDNDVAAGLVINEVDADTEGVDVLEFVELYNGTDAEIALDDYVLVFYNGNGDDSYRAIDLDGFTIASKGYFLVGNVDVPGISIEFPSNGLQNGADAVALYLGEAASFPDDTPATAAGVIDAVVYGTNDADDTALLDLFGLTTQFDEAANGNKDFDSVQRAPDGGSFVTALATPGAPADVSTQIVSVDPTTATVAEDAGTTTFEVRISAIPDADVTVDVALTSGDAADVGGFTTQTVTFPAGNGSPQVVTVTITDDAEDEGTETLAFTLQNVTGTATLGASTFNLVITDNDGQTGTGTLAELRAQPNGSEIEFEAIVTRAKGAFLRVQDETAGLTIRQTSGDVFDQVAAGQINPGDRVRVRGTLSEFRALKQINGGDLAAFEVLSSGDVPAPAMITPEDLVTNGERYEGVLVTIPNLEITGAMGTFEASTTYTLAGDSGITLRTPNADDSDIDGEPIPDGPFTFTGVVGQFSNDAP
ncbi:MAG: lamin tail domain-containing protein, partial [Bacteroidota bacterium]